MKTLSRMSLLLCFFLNSMQLFSAAPQTPDTAHTFGSLATASLGAGATLGCLSYALYKKGQQRVENDTAQAIDKYHDQANAGFAEELNFYRLPGFSWLKSASASANLGIISCSLGFIAGACSFFRAQKDSQQGSLARLLPAITGLACGVGVYGLQRAQKHYAQELKNAAIAVAVNEPDAFADFAKKQKERICEQEKSCSRLMKAAFPFYSPATAQKNWLSDVRDGANKKLGQDKAIVVDLTRE